MYNNAFAFTSFNYTSDKRLGKQGTRGGIRSFSFHGQIYQKIGPAPRNGATPKYAQLYFPDPDQANHPRVKQVYSKEWIVRELFSTIAIQNLFLLLYHSALEMIQVSNWSRSRLEQACKVVLFIV